MQPNPTQVNAFNGRSDDSIAEQRFAELYEAGALDSTDPKIAAQQQAERAQQQAEKAPQEPESKAAPEPEAKEPVKAEEAPEYADLDDYLTKAGLERDSFYSLPLKVKDQSIPLAEAIKRLEAETDVHAQTSALSERQKAFEAEQVRQTQALQQRAQLAEQLGQLAYGELVREYQSIDWNSLSQTDPARWAVLNTQFQQRQQTIQAQLNQAAQQRQDAAQKALAEEQEKLFKAFPDWKDSTKRTQAVDAMAKLGERYGISRERLLGITDSVSLRVLYDFAQLSAKDAERAAAKEVSLQRVRAAPQIVQPGARTVKDPKVSAITEAKSAFHKNPKSLDAQLAFANRIAEHL